MGAPPSFDVAFRVAALLQPADLLSLAAASAGWRAHLADESIWRRVLRDTAAHAPEAEDAARGRLSAREAVRRVDARREAVRGARPFYAERVDGVADALLDERHLCLLHGKTWAVAIYDLRDGDAPARVVSLARHARACSGLTGAGEPPRQGPDVSVQLLSFHDDVLSYCTKWKGSGSRSSKAPAFEVTRVRVLTKRADEESSFPLGSAFDGIWVSTVLLLPQKLAEPPARVLLAAVHTPTRYLNLYVHQESLFLATGTLTAGDVGQQPNQPERCPGIPSVPSSPAFVLQATFTARAMGKDIAKHLDDAGVLHLVAFGNDPPLREYDVVYPAGYDEDDYYVCARIPVAAPLERQLVLVHRRNRLREGPLHDSWSQLSLQKDEDTGNLCIVEVRRVWEGGLPRQKRLCAVKPWPWVEGEVPADWRSDPYSCHLTGGEAATVARVAIPGRTSISHAYHPPTRVHIDSEVDVPVLWQTHASFYHLNSRAFVDVFRECTNADGTSQGLRMRVASAQPVDDDGPNADAPLHSVLAGAWISEVAFPLPLSTSVVGNETCILTVIAHPGQDAATQGSISWFNPVLAAAARRRARGVAKTSVGQL